MIAQHFRINPSVGLESLTPLQIEALDRDERARDKIEAHYEKFSSLPPTRSNSYARKGSNKPTNKEGKLLTTKYVAAINQAQALEIVTASNEPILQSHVARKMGLWDEGGRKPLARLLVQGKVIKLQHKTKNPKWVYYAAVGSSFDETFFSEVK